MLVHMLSTKPQNISLEYNTQTVTIYRKRPEPCRIVSFSSLNKTESKSQRATHIALVNSNEYINSDSWEPLSQKSKNIEISSSGWDGLVSRYINSKSELLELA